MMRNGDTYQAARRVVAYRDPALYYPQASPFDPQVPYPEYPFGHEALAPENAIYGAVREVLAHAGLDRARFGTDAWNPLGELVPVGGTVLIKPNWVRHYHPLDLDMFSIITHPSVLRPLVDYAFKAVGPTGEIRIMDAPLYDTDYAEVRRICQLDDFERAMRARGVPLTIGDLRALIVKMDHGTVVERMRRDTWECEGVVFDLSDDSELAPLAASLRNVFGSDYDRRVTTAFHHAANGIQRHCYRVARRVLEADLCISVPKLKTHKKTGVTLNIKNMIGINTDKNYIPHFRVGSPSQGGDEYPDTSSQIKRWRRFTVRTAREIVLAGMGRSGERLAYGFMKILLPLREAHVASKSGYKPDPMEVFYQSVQGDTYRSGDWWGNDTCWRGALDINKILLYGMPTGEMSLHPVRRYFSVIDGVIGGDETGPLAPHPRPVGVLIAGFDPLSVDLIATQIMGLDPALIRDQRRGTQLTRYPLTHSDLPIEIVSNRPEWQGTIQPGSGLDFQPHYAWKSYFVQGGQ